MVDWKHCLNDEDTMVKEELETESWIDEIFFFEIKSFSRDDDLNVLENIDVLEFLLEILKHFSRDDVEQELERSFIFSLLSSWEEVEEDHVLELNLLWLRLHS